MLFSAHEQFLSHPLVHPIHMVSVICRGQAGSVDATRTSLPLSRTHPYSSYGGMMGLQTRALLSIIDAKATRRRCRRKSSSVGGSSFSSVDLLFRNLYTLIFQRSEASNSSPRLVYTAMTSCLAWLMISGVI